MRLPAEANADSRGFLWLTPTACRYVAQPPEWKSFEALRHRFVREFGYAPPEPHYLVSDVGPMPHLDLSAFDRNNQVLTACERAIAPLVLRHFEFDPRSSGRLDLFYNLTRCSFRVFAATHGDPHETVLADYWHSWQKSGRMRGEQFLEVGLAVCQFSLFLDTGQCHFVWWERETQALEAEETRGEILDLLCENLLSLRFGDQAAALAKAWSECVALVFDPLIQVFEEAASLDVWFYQNPKWERYWLENARVDRFRQLCAINRHPLSGHAVSDHSEFVVPNPYEDPPLDREY